MSAAAAKLRLDWCVTPAKAWHIDRMLPHVREADRSELWSGWRHTPDVALRYGLRSSSHAWTALVNFEPVVMVGVVPASLLSGSGTPWLIGTEGMERHQVGFLRRCRPHMRKIQSIYSSLSNMVASDNEVAIRWLEWLGFHVEPAVPFGPEGVLFRQFRWVRDV